MSSLLCTQGILHTYMSFYLLSKTNTCVLSDPIELLQPVSDMNIKFKCVSVCVCVCVHSDENKALWGINIMKKAKKTGSPKAFGVRLEDCQPAVNHKVSLWCFMRPKMNSYTNNMIHSVKIT